MIFAPPRKIIAPDYCPTCGKVRHPRRAPTFPARRNRWMPNRWRGGVDATNAGNGIQVSSAGAIKVRSNGIVVAGASDPCCCGALGLSPCCGGTMTLYARPQDVPSGVGAGDTVFYPSLGPCFTLATIASTSGLTPTNAAMSKVSGSTNSCANTDCPVCYHCGCCDSLSQTTPQGYMCTFAGWTGGTGHIAGSGYPIGSLDGTYNLQLNGIDNQLGARPCGSSSCCIYSYYLGSGGPQLYLPSDPPPPTHSALGLEWTNRCGFGTGSAGNAPFSGSVFPDNTNSGNTWFTDSAFVVTSGNANCTDSIVLQNTETASTFRWWFYGGTITMVPYF